MNPDVMGGHIGKTWFAQEPKQKQLGASKQKRQWPHEKEGVHIPMPEKDRMIDMKKEFYQRHEGQGVGPATKVWTQKVFAWAANLKKEWFGDTEKVTGLWQQAKSRWVKRLSRLKCKKQAEAIYQEVANGVKLPFSKKPTKMLHARQNHKCLGQRPKAVFNAICQQLKEGSVEGFDVRNGKKPSGIFSLRWVEKSNPDEVRLTLNGRPINKFFQTKDTTIELETHAQLRARYRPNQMFVGFDLHNGFFNQQYRPEDRHWVCFKISEEELGQELAKKLRVMLPTSWVGDNCYFSYRGLVMGLSPSCQQLQRVMEALLEVWRGCEVKGVVWDATNFIDDLMAMIEGTFEGAIELALRLLAEYVLLGFSVNLNEKSTIVPTTYYCHLGICISSTKMRFTLPKNRSAKMRACALRLQKAATVGKGVDAKLVAKFVGMLWSAHIVCFRAVAIMARGMIQTIATMIRASDAAGETDLHKLKYILKRVWGGQVIWTAEAADDLAFWLKVYFELLSAPISHDAWSQHINAWVMSPTTGVIASDVRVFAVDTSNTMSGGGEFVRDGWLWRMKNKMAVRLTLEEVLTSSTFRELLGAKRLNLAMVPEECKKIILALDSQAAVACIKKGSKVPALQALCRSIFANQLKHNRVIWPVWMRRCMSIIVQCDDISRWLDNHAYTTAAAIFWRANAEAIKLWGRGFQCDVCADMHNAQPAEKKCRLPFFSRWPSPMSSGVDMFQQNWGGRVHWCNPPFVLLPRIFALLKSQQACAAVVVPLGRTEAWARSIDVGDPGIMHRFEYNPNALEFAAKFALGAAPKISAPYSKNYAVLFCDFADHPPSSCFHDEPSAESLPAKAQPSTVYLGFGGEVMEV